MPRGVLTALGVMLLLQTLIAFSAHSPAVFAPVVTRDLGLAPERVGLFIVIAYLVAMFAGLACNNFIARYGPLRVVQVCIASAGLGLMIGGVGIILSVVVGALVIGFGQGMTGPASTVILAARSPRNRIALILSIKQSGVPIGAAIAGAIVPGLILAVGWQVTVGAIGAGFILIAIALQPMRASYDRARNPNVRISVAGSIIQMKESVALAWANRRLRDLSLASFAFVAIQLVVMTYLVSYLHFVLHYSLVAAGLVFAAAQVSGIAGRLLWGVLGDRVRRGDLLLGALGPAMAAFAVAAAFWTETSSPFIVYGVAVLFGITGVGWNGLFMAEVVRAVRSEEIGRATGGAQFFSFLGGIVGPPLGGAIVSAGGGYGLGFMVVAVIALVAGVNLLLGPPLEHAIP